MLLLGAGWLGVVGSQQLLYIIASIFVPDRDAQDIRPFLISGRIWQAGYLAKMKLRNPFYIQPLTFSNHFTLLDLSPPFVIPCGPMYHQVTRRDLSQPRGASAALL